MFELQGGRSLLKMVFKTEIKTLMMFPSNLVNNIKGGYY